MQVNDDGVEQQTHGGREEGGIVGQQPRLFLVKPNFTMPLLIPRLIEENTVLNPEMTLLLKETANHLWKADYRETPPPFSTRISGLFC